MSETPQPPSGEPNPQPGPTPQPNHDAQPAAGAQPAPAGPPDSGVPPQQPYGGQPGGQGGYGTPQPGQQPYPAPIPLRPDEERTWAVLAHVGGFILAFIAPLVIWLVFKERSRFVDAEAKESLNFQITLIIAYVAITILTFVTFGFGAFLYLGFIAAVVFMILGAVETSKGRPYRYPLNIRIIK